MRLGHSPTEEKMGAKDALCKVATMNIGLEDTLAYYTPEEWPGKKIMDLPDHRRSESYDVI